MSNITCVTCNKTYLISSFKLNGNPHCKTCLKYYNNVKIRDLIYKFTKLINCSISDNICELYNVDKLYNIDEYNPIELVEDFCIKPTYNTKRYDRKIKIHKLSKLKKDAKFTKIENNDKFIKVAKNLTTGGKIIVNNSLFSIF